jgi:hypothetical protein
MGKTMGEIYSEGISKVGIQYISEPPNWWWDLAENVCLYGDPDLRVWVPSTEYSSKNNWDVGEVQSLRYESDDGFSIDGHSPFGAASHPNKKIPTSIWQQYLWVILAIVTILLLLAAIVINGKRKEK